MSLKNDIIHLTVSCPTEILENVNPDLSDSEFVEREDEPQEAFTPGIAGSDAGDALTPAPGADGEDNGDDEESDAREGDIDEEFAAELDLALGDEAEQGDDDEEDEDEDDEDSDEEEEEEEDGDDPSPAKRLLNEEIRDLQSAVAKKRQEIASSSNPLIKVSARIFYLLK